jgi:succinoglycan biosynthesis transport protein ExoP
MAGGESGGELRSGLVLDALRHHLWLIVAAALAGLGIGVLATFVLGSHYTSQASVLVNPLVGNPYSPVGSGDDLANLETEAQLVKSDVVTAAVSDQTGVPQAKLQSNVHVTVPANTQILQVAYTDPNAVRAQTVAQDYAEAYLGYRADRRNANVEAQVGALEQQIDDTQTNLQAAIQQAHAGGPNSIFARTLRQTLAGQLTNLRVEVDTLRSSASDPGRVITPSVMPSSPDGLPPLVFGLAGLLLGLGVAILLAVSRERSAEMVRHVDQVEDAGIPVLGVIGGEKDTNRPRVYRAVRAAVTNALPPPMTLAVAGCSDEPAADIVAGEYAISVTRGGDHIVLIDAVGKVSMQLGSVDPRTPGLSDVLLGEATLVDALVEVSTVDHAPMWVLNPGQDPDAGAEHYISVGMLNLLRALGELSDRVIVASPGLGEPDGRVLASEASGVLLVITLNHTSYSDMVTAIDWLDRSGTMLVGAIVVASRLTEARIAEATTGDLGLFGDADHDLDEQPDAVPAEVWDSEAVPPDQGGGMGDDVVAEHGEAADSTGPNPVAVEDDADLTIANEPDPSEEPAAVVDAGADADLADADRAAFDEADQGVRLNESPGADQDRADQDSGRGSSKNGSRSGGQSDTAGVAAERPHSAAERRRRQLEVLRRSRDG